MALSVLTHFLVQFDWRQHFSPRGHISSYQQPVIESHPGMGFSTGHVPGLAPENQSINQSISPLISQSRYQSIDPSIHPSIHQSINNKSHCY